MTGRSQRQKRSGVLSSLALDIRFGYAGYRWDQQLHKYHARHRVYDPLAGRWLNRDPIGYDFTFNLYEYAYDLPLNFADPYGLYGVGGIWRNIKHGVRKWWNDTKDGFRELKDTWKEIGKDPSKYRQWAGDDDAIDEVQDALSICECIPLAEQVVAPINIGLDLIQGDCKGAGGQVLCAIVPGPGGRNPTKKIIPNKHWPIPSPGGAPTLRNYLKTHSIADRCSGHG